MAEVNGSGEPNEVEVEDEVIDLFADEFDDKALLEPEAEDEVEGDDAPTPNEAGDSDDLPEKFRGKSVREVVQAYENLEKEYGRRNNEIGELRSQVNSIIERQLATPTSRADDDDDVDYEDDPRKAVAKAVAESPEVKQIRESLQQRERAEALAKFKDSHPDADKVIADPQFQSWIQSSATRVRLFQEADVNYDYATATDLLNDYKALHAVKDAESKEQRGTKMRALKNAAPASGAASGGKRKMYKASDLMRMKDVDPDRYEKLQSVITQAYADGRVIRDL
jgi:hypothetical protein